MATTDLDLGRYQLGWSDDEDYVFKPKKGLNEDIVREMSAMKNEPEWMRDFRLKALRRFERKPMAPWFAVNMPDLDFDDIYYYIKPTDGQVDDWNDLPTPSRTPTRSWASPRPSASTSPASRPSTRARWSSTATGRTSRPRASSSATWTPPCASTPSSSASGSARSSRPTTTSSPPSTRRCGRAARSSTSRPGVKVDMPLQAYFRINAENMGQFERTLIIADEGSQVHYIEGCSAPVYTTDSLHSAVVELVALPGAGSRTRPSRTGPTTSTTWSPSGPGPRPRRTSSGSTATSARA